MKIHERIDDMGEYAIVETDEPKHYVHVSERNGKVSIYVHDHLNITIDGEHKDEPMVHIYSDEFSTKLKVTDPEHSFKDLPTEGL